MQLSQKWRRPAVVSATLLLGSVAGCTPYTSALLQAPVFSVSGPSPTQSVATPTTSSHVPGGASPTGNALKPPTQKVTSGTIREDVAQTEAPRSTRGNLPVPPALPTVVPPVLPAPVHQALQDYQQGRYEAVVVTGKQFLQQSPNAREAGFVQYLLGEALYAQQQYEAAIVAFDEVVQKHPQDPKVATALLKMGVAFAALRDMRNARSFLGFVRQRFPQSPEAQWAQLPPEQLWAQRHLVQFNPHSIPASQPVVAQPAPPMPPLDILGLQVGMREEQALARLRAHKPNPFVRKIVHSTASWNTTRDKAGADGVQDSYAEDAFKHLSVTTQRAFAAGKTDIAQQAYFLKPYMKVGIQVEWPKLPKAQTTAFGSLIHEVNQDDCQQDVCEVIQLATTPEEKPSDAIITGMRRVLVFGRARPQQDTLLRDLKGKYGDPTSTHRGLAMSNATEGVVPLLLLFGGRPDLADKMTPRVDRFEWKFTNPNHLATVRNAANIAPCDLFTRNALVHATHQRHENEIVVQTIKAIDGDKYTNFIHRIETCLYESAAAEQGRTQRKERAIELTKGWTPPESPAPKIKH